MLTSNLLNNFVNFVLYHTLPFLLLLAFCVIIHEFGHFLFAKLFRIPVEKFSIGFGPPLFKKKIGETDFRIAYFPLGGYVKMVGEEEGEMPRLIKKEDTIPETPEKETPVNNKKSEIETGFYDAPIYKRILIVFAGSFFNIVSALIVLFIILNAYGVIVNPYMKIEVEEGSYAEKSGFLNNDSIISVNGHSVENWEEFWQIVNNNKKYNNIIVTVVRNNLEVEIQLPLDTNSIDFRPFIPPVLGTLKLNSPAYKAGMKKGDRVLKIDGHEVNNWEQMVEIIRVSKGQSLQFTWKHMDEIKTAQVTPDSFYDPILKDTIGQIGVFMPHQRRYLPVFNVFILSMERTGKMIVHILEIFYLLITRQIPVRQLGGPIAIFKLSTESAKWGFEHLLGLVVIISINLGLINLFPLPALDGGHILIAVIETIRGKRFSKNTRMTIQQIGYAIILLLIIFVTFNDITR